MIGAIPSAALRGRFPGVSNLVFATVAAWVFAGQGLDALCAAAEPVFADRTEALGLALANGAACWADLDRDCWTDLCAGGVAWRNVEGKRFEKLAEGLGEVVAADFDGDGWIDLASWSTLRVLRNKQGRGFEPITLPALPKCVSRGACWGDWNRDGYVDLYVGGYEDWDAGITYTSFVLLNQASPDAMGRTFAVGLTDARYRARGVSACDFDEDGDLDIYASNYRLQPNVLWQNDGQGKFADVAAKFHAEATSPGFAGGHSIGAAWGDFDNDGRFDLFAANFAHVDGRGDQPKSRFLRNLGAERQFDFEDRGPCGVFYQESYASPAVGDYDNDGDLDLFFTTVYDVASFGHKNNPTLFRNDGSFQFTDVTAAAQLANLPPTYQAAWADFDRDGDLDLVTAGKLFVNQSSGHHWLTLNLVTSSGETGSPAIGAQVRARIGDRTVARQVEAGTGEGNQNDLTLHLGLGAHAEPVDCEVRWPNGKVSTTRVAIDQRAVLTQPSAAP